MVRVVAEGSVSLVAQMGSMGPLASIRRIAVLDIALREFAILQKATVRPARRVLNVLRGSVKRGFVWLGCRTIRPAPRVLSALRADA